MERLCDSNKCTGCTACMETCARHAITMKADSEGFLFPEIDTDTCSGCGLCEKACPQLRPVERHPAPSAYAAWNLCNAIRCASSSGGLFYTFAQQIIEQQGVVFGAVLSEDMCSVSHAYAETLEELKPMMGSKYVQSNLGESFRRVADFLKSGRRVLFTGTPCQVAGLYGFLGKCDKSNLYTVDVICHGVPSAELLKFYLSDGAVQKRISSVGPQTGRANGTPLAFRNPAAWPDSFTGPMKDYVSLFLSGQFMRESCFSCKYTTTSRISDITIGDFWGIGEKIPFEGDTSKGCSIVLVNTPAGQSLLDSVKGSLFIEERRIEEALERNTQLHTPTKRSSGRDTAYNYIRTHSLLRTIIHFEDSSRARKVRHWIKRWAKNCIGK